MLVELMTLKAVVLKDLIIYLRDRARAQGEGDEGRGREKPKQTPW